MLKCQVLNWVKIPTKAFGQFQILHSEMLSFLPLDIDTEKNVYIQDMFTLCTYDIWKHNGGIPSNYTNEWFKIFI